MKFRVVPYLIFIFCTCLLGCYKDENADTITGHFFDDGISSDGNPYNEYNGVSHTAKDFFFVDFFSDNIYNWPTGLSEQFYSSVSNGLYTICNGDESQLRWVTTSLGIDYSRSFEVEATIAVLSSTDDDGGGLILEADDNDFICLLLDSKDRCSVMSFEEGTGKFTKIRSWSDASFYYTSGQQALLTIRKVADTYYFFVNEHFVTSSPADASLDDNIGFLAKGNVDFEVDMVRASYLNI